MDPLVPSEVSIIPPLPDGWGVVRYLILAGGDLAIIAENGGPESTDSAVWILAGDQLVSAVRLPVDGSCLILDRFSDGRWLGATTRSSGDGNARVLSPNGVELDRIELGDGIEHLKIDAADRVWVGWFDEGVFGNDTWRVAGMEWAPSSSGMAAFDPAGNLLRHATLQTVADCYSLNVVGVEAWTCTYADFPLWRMEPDGTETTWSTELSGVRAIAVNYPYVMAAGGYKDDRDRLVLLRLEGSLAKPVGEWRLPWGVVDFRQAWLLDGRGEDVHVVSKGRWLKWNVRELVDRFQLSMNLA